MATRWVAYNKFLDAKRAGFKQMSANSSKCFVLDKVGACVNAQLSLCTKVIGKSLPNKKVHRGLAGTENKNGSK